jgi:hypothetical protein
MIYDIDGVTLELTVTDGMLSVARADGTPIGSVLVAEIDPDPDPAEEIASPDDASPEEPVVPDGWVYLANGDVVDDTGKSIFGTNPTEGQENPDG